MAATIALPAALVVPVAGALPGAVAAVKLAAAACCAALWAWHDRRAGRLAAPELALLGFLLAATVGTLLSGVAWTDATPALVGAAALMLLTRGLRRCEWSSIESAIVLTAAGVAAIAALEMLGVHWPWTGLRRPESSFGSRNYLAGYLVIALPITLAAGLRGRRYALPIAALLCTVIVVTRCRGAYLAGAAALLAALAVHALLRRRAAPAIPRPRLLAAVVAVLIGSAAAAAPWPGLRFGPSIGDSIGRVLELDQGSGRVRVQQHRLGAGVLAAEPSRALLGRGAGTWERAASAHAHSIGQHTPMLLGPATPNSDLLRVAVEQGLLGVACLLAALALAVAAALRSGAARPGAAAPPAIVASLVAAGTFGLVDAPLTHAACISLIAALLAAAASPGPLAGRRAMGSALLVLAALAAAVALLRAGSFVVSGELLVDDDPDTREARLELATQLFPRPALSERLALTRATQDRCDAAEAALGELIAAHPHHWGARIQVAACFARNGRPADARRLWRDAFAVEPHLPALLADPAAPRFFPAP